MTTIGVLALQGAFMEHVRKLRRIGVDVREVRLPAEIEGLDGLIIPGGESTTIGKLIERFNMRDDLLALVRSGRPVWGTCAGMILMGRDVVEESRASDQPLLGVLDVSVRRNAFGSQLDSFETDLDVPMLGSDPLPVVFIRAPVVESVGPDVEVLARLDDGRIVAVRQGNLVATAFHPELTDDDRFHIWFVELAEQPSDTEEDLAGIGATQIG